MFIHLNRSTDPKLSMTLKGSRKHSGFDQIFGYKQKNRLLCQPIQSIHEMTVSKFLSILKVLRQKLGKAHIVNEFPIKQVINLLAISSEFQKRFTEFHLTAAENYIFFFCYVEEQTINAIKSATSKSIFYILIEYIIATLRI